MEGNGKMKDHYIMDYYGWAEKDGKLYIFLEMCPYGTLKDRLYEPMNQLQALRLFRQLVEGMC